MYSRQVGAHSGRSWNGLRFEVQLRTVVQHAWATVIEVYDSIQQARFKFEGSANPAYEQFLIISEIFARIYENKTACKPELSDDELVQAHDSLENQTHMVSTIDSLNVAGNYGHLKKDTILKRTTSGELFVYRYSSFQAAMRSIAEIEQESDTENAVLVSAATPNHIRDAFRNYFDDTNDFVQLLRGAIHEIKSSQC